MTEFLKILRWIFFYLITSVFAIAVAIFSTDLVWPDYDVSEQSSGPIEQQLYLLLVDRGYWMTESRRHFRKEMTKQGRERFAKLLHDIRFKRDCLGGANRKHGEDLECTVNGEWIYFVWK